MITSEEIKRRLWNGANELRGSMDASRYKDYMLGLMFYKFLSDKTLEAFRDSAGIGKMSELDLVKRYTKDREEYGNLLDETLQEVLRYYVLPEYLYQTWIMDINSGDFELQKVTDSLHNFERTIAVEAGNTDFKGLFSSSTIDLTDTALGSNLKERSDNIQKLIMLFADLNMVDLQEGDILGDAYEYLIGQFAMESGKKAGEFYTPHQVSEIMARIVTNSSKIESIYDPTVGSGSLLITVGKHLKDTEKKDLHYYGQEKNTTTYNLARMNLLLHGVRPEKMTVRNANTLGYDWPEDPNRPNEGVQFDAVVMNPPYSAKNWNKEGLKISDPRFQIGGVLPPDSKGDFAFLLHGLFHLRQSGTMAIVLPHGVLFRGGAEGEIRQRLLEKNYIDTIIGLPSNLFTNTGIPVVIIVLKKNRKLEDPILVIDSSEEFIKVGKQNVLEEKNIAKIVDTYVEKKEEEGYSALVYRKDLIENDYNMNIPRYVVKISEEIEHDVEGHLIGAIPKKDIEGLKILNLLVKDILYKSLEEVDNGYYILSKKIDELTKEILTSNEVVQKSKTIKEKTDLYIKKYWDKLINVDENSDINSIKKDMLLEIKEIMEEFSYVNIYNGYQNISNIWEENLKTDLELIKACDFYELGRKREPNIVIKGTGKKKREEQEGWVGSLVPNELIVQNLYSKENQEIEDLKNKLSDIESSLDEIVENAKIEGTEEYEVLYDCLNRNKEDEVTNSFGKTAIKNEKKMYEKDSEEYKMLKNVEKLMDDKTSINKEIKSREEELTKNTQERILKLKDEEIDKLVYDKWFKNLESEMINLIEKPIKEEIDILENLSKRYKYTLEEIEKEEEKLDQELQSLLDELVKN